jgi:hypothetical protein
VVLCRYEHSAATFRRDDAFLQHRAEQPNQHQPLASDQPREHIVSASMSRKHEEGNERDYGQGQTNEACQDPRMLHGRTDGADCAVATEPVWTESDRNTKQEEVTDREQPARAKERNCCQ